MSRYTPKNSSEFESRQMAFDFGAAARFVAELAASVKKSLGKWWSEAKPKAQKTLFKTWKQLVLESDDIHQLPLTAN